MLKNFHTQFDVEKKIISFFTNDSSLLEIKGKKSKTTDEPEIIPNNLLFGEQ